MIVSHDTKTGQVTLKDGKTTVKMPLVDYVLALEGFRMDSQYVIAISELQNRLLLERFKHAKPEEES